MYNNIFTMSLIMLAYPSIYRGIIVDKGIIVDGIFTLKGYIDYVRTMHKTIVEDYHNHHLSAAYSLECKNSITHYIFIVNINCTTSIENVDDADYILDFQEDISLLNLIKCSRIKIKWTRVDPGKLNSLPDIWFGL